MYGRCDLELELLEWECCVRDYHVYQHLWKFAIGEELNNLRYIVAVVKKDG